MFQGDTRWGVTVEVGDIVAYMFDTGAFGLTVLYGVVEKSGSKTFTVRWVSGNRNRLRQGDRRVRKVTKADELDEARRSVFR